MVSAHLRDFGICEIFLIFESHKLNHLNCELQQYRKPKYHDPTSKSEEWRLAIIELTVIHDPSAQSPLLSTAAIITVLRAALTCRRSPRGWWAQKWAKFGKALDLGDSKSKPVWLCFSKSLQVSNMERGNIRLPAFGTSLCVVPTLFSIPIFRCGAWIGAACSASHTWRCLRLCACSCS
jgi:hypothetical protein